MTVHHPQIEIDVQGAHSIIVTNPKDGRSIQLTLSQIKFLFSVIDLSDRPVAPNFDQLESSAQ
jgi:hypothetical protein